MMNKPLTLRVFDRNVSIRTDRQTEHLLRLNFGFLAADVDEFDLEFTVQADSHHATFAVTRRDQPTLIAGDVADLLFIVEKDMTIELQKIRHDLYFLHGAALEHNGRACMIVAPSGSGKSTTAWALLHHGFRYLSDELAPVDLNTMAVTPYPHALNLKSDPPAPYRLPEATLRTSGTLHVPVAALPGPAISHATPLSAIFFLRHTPNQPRSTIRPLHAAEAGARLYANTLNLLAHPAGGIDAAIAIARHSRCYSIDSSDLTQTCALISATMAAPDTTPGR